MSKPDTLKETQYGGTHYKNLVIEPAEYCQKNKLGFCESSAIKYLTRHASKGKAEDVKKAIHFAQMVLEMEYGIKTNLSYKEGDWEVTESVRNYETHKEVDVTCAITEKPKWEVVPAVENDKTIGYQIRWSEKRPDGKYLWVGHYYEDEGNTLGWCERAARSHAKRLNEQKEIPSAYEKR